MRQAINNLQSTHSGFGFISGDNVFKVCDQPHPIIIQATIRACLKGDVDTAVEKLNDLWTQGYSAVDIVVTIFRVVKTFDEYVFILADPTLLFFIYSVQDARIHKVGIYQGVPWCFHYPDSWLNVASGDRIYAYENTGRCGDTHSACGSGRSALQSGMSWHFSLRNRCLILPKHMKPQLFQV